MKSEAMVNKLNQKGIALIQVLLLSTILAIMALQFTLSSRQQVRLAADFKDKILADIGLRTLESQVLMALLSLPKSPDTEMIQQQDAIGKEWNFYGEPFSVNPDIQVSIQDINGQISIYGLSNLTPFRQLLAVLGKSDPQVREIIDNLLYWQGKKDSNYTTPTNQAVRSNYMVSKTELKHIRGIDDDLYRKLEPLVTTFQTYQYNPLIAPKLILQSALPSDVYQELKKLRETGELTSSRYLELSPGFDDDVITFQSGSRFEVKLLVKKGSAVAKRSVIWYIRPENRIPVVWLQ